MGEQQFPSERYWKTKTHEAFMDWIDEQPANWAITTFSCYTTKRANSDADEYLTLGSTAYKNWLSGAPTYRRNRQPCTVSAIVDGYGKTVRALDRKYLSTPQRKKGSKLLRVPYMGGDKGERIPYHVHSLIELPLGVEIEDFRTYINKIFQSTMQEQLKNKSRLTVHSNVWCEPYIEMEHAFFYYCGRYEGATLSVGLDKVVFPHLIMNPPMVGAI